MALRSLVRAHARAPARAFVLAAAVLLGAPALATAQPRIDPRARVVDPAQTLIREASELQSRKKYAEALVPAERALAMREKAGRDSTETMMARGLVADLLVQKGDHARAVVQIEKMLATHEKSSSDTRELEVLFTRERLARAVLEAGDHARAVQLFEQVSAGREKKYGADTQEMALGLWSLGNTLRRVGDLVRAETTILRALAIAEKASNVREGNRTAVVGSMLLDLGRVYRERGLHAKAVTVLERAVTVREKAWGADHGEVVSVLEVLGPTYARVGDFSKAEQALTRARKRTEELAGPDSADLATALVRLGMVLDEKGEHARAQPLHRRALEIYEKVLPASSPLAAAGRIALGQNLLAEGAVAASEPLLTRGLSDLEKALGAKAAGLAGPLSSVAELHLRKRDFARAEAALGRALAIHEKTLGPLHPDVARDKSALARLAAAKGDARAAERFHSEALAIRERAFGGEHPEVASSLLALAELHRRGRSGAKAEPLYRRALAISEKTLGPDHVRVAEALAGLAALDAAAGKHDQAIAGQARVADVLEQNLSLVLASGSEAQKREFLAGLSDSTDFTLSLHLALAPKVDAAERLALDTILQRKGRVLDVMADAMASLRRRLDPQGRALLADLSLARSRLAALSLRGPGAGSAEAYREELAGLVGQAQKLEESIGEKSAAFRAESTAASIARVQAAMPEDAVLVEYFVYRPVLGPGTGGAPRYAAYTLTPKGVVRSVDLGDAAAIDQAALALRKALSRPDGRDATELARALDEKVLRPVRALLGGATRLLVSPDGALNVVPFAALVDEDRKLQIERYEVSYLTSGRDLLRLQFRSASKSAPVVVANPAFGRAGRAPPAAAPERSAGLGRAVFEPLPGTASEGRAVAALLPGAALRVDVEATEAALKAIVGPSILHVATHGFFLAGQRPTTPGGRGLSLETAPPPPPPTGAAVVEPVSFENPLLRSGLALAGANPRQSGDEDGILTALEAASLDLDGTQLVVLSACETGLGELQNGDGVYGLKRAFVLAGAETEVVSLWKVADEETKDLMIAYYGRLKSGGARSGALRDVQRAMLAKPATAHPYFWASFAVSGDPTPLREGPALPPEVASARGAPPASTPVTRPGANVAPGAGGCACEAAGVSRGPLGAWWLGVLLAPLAARARRAKRRRAHLHVDTRGRSYLPCIVSWSPRTSHTR